MTTLVSAWQEARAALLAAGVEEPTVDARLLLEAGAGVKRLDILTDPRRELSEAQIQSVAALVARRVLREPISQILGRRGFRTLELAVTRDVLTPRPETEMLADAALEVIAPDAVARVLDLGIGSGAILAAVLSERAKATGVGVDRSEAALGVARANIDALGLADRVELRLGDWGEGIEGVFDVILANPPYIPSAEIETLAPEVARYEPRLALDGGADGLDAFRALLPHAARLLAPGGRLALEFGLGQAAPLRALIVAAGLQAQEIRADLAGLERVWIASV